MKIRGNTVGTTIKPEQAVVKCQNLTEEQKAQARENIGAAAASGQYELIEDITLAETVAEFRRNTTPDGSEYNFTAVRIIVDALANTTTSVLGIIMYKDSTYGRTILHTNVPNGMYTADRCTYFKFYNDCGLIESCYATVTSGSHTQLGRRLSALDTPWENVKAIEIRSSVNIPAGSRIRIYAVRG